MMKKTYFATALIVLISSSLVRGQSTWTSTSSSDFGTAGNWSPGGVPNSNTTPVTFNGNATVQTTVNLAAAYTVEDFSFGGTASNFTFTQTNSGTLTIDDSGSAASIAVSSGGTEYFNLGTTFTGTGAGAGAISFSGSGGALVFGSTGTLTLNTGLTIGSGDTAAGTVTINGAINAAGSKTISVTGPDTLNYGATAMTGTVALVSSGTSGTAGEFADSDGGGAGSVLNLQSTKFASLVLGLNSGSTIGGVLYLTANGLSVSVSEAATSTAITSGSLTIGSNVSGGGTTTIANSFALTGVGSTSAVNQYFYAAANNTLIFNGAITGGTATTATATGKVEITGSGIVVFNAGNSYAEDTVINSGATLQIGNGAGTGSINGTGSGSLSPQLTDNGTLIIDRTGVTQASIGNGSGVGPVIAGTGSVIQAISTGTTTLLGNNTYTGTTTVNAGMLRAGASTIVGTSGAFGAGSGAMVVNTGGTLDLNGFNVQVGSLSGTGGTITDSSATANHPSVLTVSNTATGTIYAGVIQNGSTNTTALSLASTDTGALTLTNNNTYTGGTTISGGTLYANNGGGVTATPLTSTTSTITATNSTGSATGTGAVTVASTGTVAGSGTISGPVTVQAGGTLSSGAAQAIGSPYQVTSTGLTLTGSLGINAGASLTFALGAGSQVAALNFSNPNTDSTYMSVTGSTAGEINFGTGSTITINLTDLTSAVPLGPTLALRYSDPYLLIQAGSDADYANLVTTGGVDANGYVLGVGTSSADYTAFTLQVTDANGNVISNTANYGGLQLYLYNGDLEVVPEPGTWALMLGGLSLLVLIQRRKNKVD